MGDSRLYRPLATMQLGHMNIDPKVTEMKEKDHPYYIFDILLVDL